MNYVIKLRSGTPVILGLMGITLFVACLVLTTLPDSNKAIKAAAMQHSKNATIEYAAQTANKGHQTLSSDDSGLYEQTFEAQKMGDWRHADRLLKKIQNPVLMGHLLAQRYLHVDYTTNKKELAQWLAAYSDHPQAMRIHTLATRKGVKAAAIPTSKFRNLSGYGESYKNKRFSSPRIAGMWKTALNYWKAENYTKAYQHFVSLENISQTMGEWDRAAISFWAFRAAHRTGDYNNANEHLENAAQYPRSFYGAQAIHLLGDSLDNAVALRGKGSLNDYLTSIDSAETRTALIRIEALIHAKQTKLAHEEILLHYAKAKPEDRVAFAQLTRALDMPALQLRMGVDMERKGITAGEALYPLPKWQPKDGYSVDPALVFAIARQESGFNEKAKSYAGAQGAMQIMPETAKYIAEKMDVDGKLSLNDPVTSITLGQHYLGYLANKPYIRGNIVLIAAAYNAGPGNAKRWAQRASMEVDPLYFIETLPFGETRDYIMNVMANYWMYREIMNDGNPGATLLSQGSYPMTVAPSQFAVMLDSIQPNA